MIFCSCSGSIKLESASGIIAKDPGHDVFSAMAMIPDIQLPHFSSSGQLAGEANPVSVSFFTQAALDRQGPSVRSSSLPIKRCVSVTIKKGPMLLLHLPNHQPGRHPNTRFRYSVGFVTSNSTSRPPGFKSFRVFFRVVSM